MKLAQIHVPDDFEPQDGEVLLSHIEDMMTHRYPPFEPEIVHGERKDYFLPALKVLYRVDDEFYSPVRSAEWSNGILKAECVGHEYYVGQPPPDHKAPHRSCDCGIYGSVNVREIEAYLTSGNLPGVYGLQARAMGKTMSSASISTFVDTPIQRFIPERVLCLIEPLPGAKVLVARKGWRASAAFISEVVGVTITLEDTARILEIAWHRPFNLLQLIRKEGDDYENR